MMSYLSARRGPMEGHSLICLKPVQAPEHGWHDPLPIHPQSMGVTQCRFKQASLVSQ